MSEISLQFLDKEAKVREVSWSWPQSWLAEETAPSSDLSDSTAQAPFEIPVISQQHGISNSGEKVWVYLEDSLPELELPFEVDLCATLGYSFLSIWTVSTPWHSAAVTYFKPSIPLSWIIIKPPNWDRPSAFYSICLFSMWQWVILLKVRTCHSFTQGIMASHFPWSKTIENSSFNTLQFLFFGCTV